MDIQDKGKLPMTSINLNDGEPRDLITQTERGTKLSRYLQMHLGQLVADKLKPAERLLVIQMASLYTIISTSPIKTFSLCQNVLHSFCRLC